MQSNPYVPFPCRIQAVQRHTALEYTFRLAYEGQVKPGQFFEVSLPKYGEAPISVSGLGRGYIDFTIRRVGKVTNEIFEHYAGQSLFLRGPYGNGFSLEDYKGKELVVIAGGTGLSPVRGLVDYFAQHNDELKSMNLVAGFKSPADILFFDDITRWKQSMNVILTVDCGDDSGIECHIGLVTQFIPDLKLQDPAEACAIVVGPPAMMRFSIQGLQDIGFQAARIWISHERKMCCGLGKCGHCKIDKHYVCLDGPVFNYAAAADLLD